MRYTSIFAAVLLASPAFSTSLPLDVLDTADVNYNGYQSSCGGGMSCISDANSLGIGGGSDHYDHAFGISVNGNGYDATQGTSGSNTLDLEQLALSGFDVSVSFLTTGAFLRQIVSLTNGEEGSQNATVAWHNNTGNDGGQRVIGTSDGDNTAETSDNWVVTADNNTGTDNEVNAWLYHGFGGLLPTSIGLVDGSADFGYAGEQGFNAVFDLNIAAGETQSLMFFAVAEGINQDGIDGAASVMTANGFASLTGDLSAGQLRQIQNWGPVAPSPVPLPAGAVLMLSGMGLLALRRARKAA